MASIKSVLGRLSPRGKIALGGAPLAILILVFVLFQMATKQSYTTLATGIEPAETGQVTEAVNLFRAKVVDVTTESLTIEATGTPAKLEAFMRVLEPYGIRELAQSGVVSLSRGPRGIGTVK